MPTYQSAWLKAHHPAAFYAGLLTHDPGMYPKRLLLADARRRGVPVLPLDVNRSGADYQVELVSGRMGCCGSRCPTCTASASEETARLVAGRPYASLQDLWQRARPGRPVAERLVRVGALDGFLTGSDANRRDLLLQVAELHRRRGGPARSGQLPLPAGGPEAGIAAAGFPDLDDGERLDAELGDPRAWTPPTI